MNIPPCLHCVVRVLRRITVVAALACLIALSCSAQETYEPSDPIAAVDGKPIRMGELNLLLRQQFPRGDLGQVPVEVKQATALVLVRQHLAFSTLKKKGRDALRLRLEREISAVQDDLQRRGTSMEARARESDADAESLIARLAWQSAWAQYIKSRLTEKNLRLFFDRNKHRYGAKRFEISQIFVPVVRDPKTKRIDQASQRATVAEFKELANEIQSASAFDSIKPQYRSAAQSDAEGSDRIWVSKSGDLPPSVLAAVQRSEGEGILSPVVTSLGVHLVYVHAVEEVEMTFDELTDQAALRRDATNAMFEALVATGRDAKVQWFIPDLKPPADVPLVPN